MHSKIVSSLKIILLAIFLSFGLSFVYAWTVPTSNPPAGNVSAPINTSSTAQTKVGNLTTTGTITSGGDICSVIAGVTKCLSTTSAILPAGTISATAATCTIASGASTCSVSVTWNITNATTPNLYNLTTGTQLSTLASGTNVAITISNGATTLQARNGSTSLNSVVETASCASGTMWSGGSGGLCQPTTATITVYSPCAIPNGGSNCSGAIDWGVQNATSPNLYNVTTGTQIATGAGTRTFTNFAYGTNNFIVRDGTTQLASGSGTAVCSGGAWWNGSICDPAWVAKATMPTPRGYASAATLNNKIYVFGGLDGAGNVTAATEEYDAVSNSWGIGASMINPRYSTSAATVGTKIYVMGGEYKNTPPTDCGGSPFYYSCSTNDEYSPLSGTWLHKLKAPLQAGYRASSAVVNNKVYLFNWDSTYVYDPASNTWVAKLVMPTARFGTVASAVGTKIYVIGGESSASNEEYDTLTNTWSTKASMPYGVYGGAASVANGKIYVMCGTRYTVDGPQMYNQEYDPATNVWRLRLNAPSSVFTVSATVNNKIYLIGSGNQTWASWISGGTMEYDPSKDLTP